MNEIPPYWAIVRSTKEILGELKVGYFTRRDLEFLLKFFKKIVEKTERMLKEGGIK